MTSPHSPAAYTPHRVWFGWRNARNLVVTPEEHRAAWNTPDGPCARCHATCHRYGPGGNPLCAACQPTPQTPAAAPAARQRPTGDGGSVTALPLTPPAPLARQVRAAGLVTEQGGDLVEQRFAVFDPAHIYRYLLAVHWTAGPVVVFVMLNPSTADAHRNDPTLRRCLEFARREHAGTLIVVNLFALRATDPAALTTHPNPVGPANDAILTTAVYNAGLVIAAWGAHGVLHQRDQAVKRLLAGTCVACLGVTRGGQPRHPLYLPATAPLTTYRPALGIIA